MRPLPMIAALAAVSMPAIAWSQTTPVPEAPAQEGAAPAASATQAYQPLTIERIFGKTAIRGDSFDGGEWTEDGR
ncbi:hypothetical protein ACQJ25_26925, partial [Klebsiella pneumoniae]|uniref:hypothetical protein n=1 Tax=Klebsiella pneumoniae TaxID=573 RepID=UPI003CFD88F1